MAETLLDVPQKPGKKTGTESKKGNTPKKDKDQNRGHHTDVKCGIL